MNNNIPTGVTRWTPSVTHFQDQWAAQNPGLARGKVWQPKPAPPPPPSTIPQTKIEDLNNESLDEVVVSGGYPLDLSTLRPPGSTRQADSPLDLSLKTRKRCADSTLQVQHFGHAGKKMCLPSLERVHGRSRDQQVHVQHGIADAPSLHSQQYMTNVDRLHQSVDHVTAKREYSQTRHVQHVDHSLMKQDYNVPKQHVQNVQTIQHCAKRYPADQTDVRHGYPQQTYSRQYPSSNVQSFPSEASKVHHHSYSSTHRVNHPQAQEVSKYHMYPGSVQKDRQQVYKEHAQYFNPRTEMMTNIHNGSSSSSKSVDSAHYQLMAQAQKAMPTMATSKYTGTRSPHGSYEYVRHNPAVSATYSSSHGFVTSRSQSLHHNRPSVLSSGLQFKQPQECCSPDSTNNMPSPADFPHSVARSYVASNTCVSQDMQIRRQVEMKNARISNMNYPPSSSPRCNYMSTSSNVISNRKSPSSKHVSRTPVSMATNLPKAQNTTQSRSIVLGTSAKIDRTSVSECQTVIRNPRPRLWNPEQLKQSSYKSEEKIEEQVSAKTTENDITTKLTAPTQEVNNPLEISIPLSNATETKTDHKPKPFSKKHIIMNAFRNDESMKHILDEPRAPPPVPQSDAHQIKNPGNVPRSQENAVFISPESPKMPTLSPQQKLPAPKVSPLMREPPTLDIASSQGNKRKQRISPNNKIQIKNTFEEPANPTNQKQDYSIQPQSSFPQRPKTSYKKIPVANVAPMVHGKCPVEEDRNPESEKDSSYDLKQFVSAPVPQAIHAYRMDSAIQKQQDTADIRKSKLEFSKDFTGETITQKTKSKRGKFHTCNKEQMSELFPKTPLQNVKEHESLEDNQKYSPCLVSVF